MEDHSTMQAPFVAPCGMNCAICSGYLREKNKCGGCNSSVDNMPNYCVNCIIRNCEVIANSESKLCYECGKYPCTRLKQLDKRYRTRYGMSMLENLNQIRDFGMEHFLRNEQERWTCKSCGATLCVHRDLCVICKTPRESKLRDQG